MMMVVVVVVVVMMMVMMMMMMMVMMMTIKMMMTAAPCRAPHASCSPRGHPSPPAALSLACAICRSKFKPSKI